MAGEYQYRKRGTYRAVYRVEAARRVIESGRPIAHVAAELGIGAQLLGRWVHVEQARQTGEPTGELNVDERAELKRLRREVDELRKDNEFLGKAAAFSAVVAHHGRTVRADGAGERGVSLFPNTDATRLLETAAGVDQIQAVSFRTLARKQNLPHGLPCKTRVAVRTYRFLLLATLCVWLTVMVWVLRLMLN